MCLIRRYPPPLQDKETGAALLTVLLLVAILSVIAVLMLERASLANNLAINSADRTTARWLGFGLEAVAIQRISNLEQQGGRLPPVTEGGGQLVWQVPLENGGGQISVGDAGTCFNVNSLVEGNNGRLAEQPAALQQFVRLANVLQIDARIANDLGLAITDWIDSDQQTVPGGAEDGYYLRQGESYRTGGQLVSEVAELRAVRGMDDETFATLQPWLCALPQTELSQYNINQLRPEQSPLIASLLPPEISPQRARDVIANRPSAGFPSTVAFWQAINVQTAAIRPEAQAQVVVNTRWYALDMTIRVGDAIFTEEALVDGNQRPAMLIQRSWDQ